MAHLEELQTAKSAVEVDKKPEVKDVVQPKPMFGHFKIEGEEVPTAVKSFFLILGYFQEGENGKKNNSQENPPKMIFIPF